jgi:xanthine dehydrogenase YagS FAD-binding subunit
MRAFAYGQAAEMAEALAEGGAPDTVFLAGGTELLNWLRLGIANPARVIGIARIEGLAGIRRLQNGGLHLGALTRLNDTALHEDVARDYPVLSTAILKSASAQLRNLATIGGNPLQKTLGRAQSLASTHPTTEIETVGFR